MSNQGKQIDNRIEQDLPDVKEIEDYERRVKRVFKNALDRETSNENRYLAVSARMGDNKSYISSVRLRWFADVNFASDLDIFEKYRDENNKSIEINEETLSMLSQRKPDWSRQLAMTVYLAIRKHRKFPPALLVAYQDWILNPDHDNWGMDGRALKDSIENKALDSQAWVVSLNHADTKFYALDGQHRLMSIRGLRDLIQGNLSKKNKDGKAGKPIKIEDVLGHQANSNDENKEDLRRRIESILDQELIGIEIIPAVQRGETRDEAFMRLRQIFVDVNQNPKRLEKGELALLDENDGFKIVARNVMISNELFRTKDNSIRVDTKSSQLNENSEDYTTLQSIAKTAKLYLERRAEFEHWNDEVCKIKGAGKLRPDDSELDDGEKKLTAYFDAIKTLPSHKLMIDGTKKVAELRGRDGDNHDNVLFRPIAQEALASAIGFLEQERGLTLEQICKKLAKKDDRSCPDLKLTDTVSPFFGVLCDPVEKKMRKDSYLKLAKDMFCHLLGGEEPDHDVREKFREDVFQSRRITTEADESAEALDFGGKPVSRDKFKLPKPW